MASVLIGALLFVLWCVAVNGRVTRSTSDPQPIWNSTATDKLRHDLLHSYDKFARPAQHYNKTLVSLDLVIRHVEINELKSTFTVNSYIKLSWNDEKLKWNPDIYGGLSVLHVADHEIWQPDIFLYNSAESASFNHQSNVHCLIYASNGNVVWVLPVIFTSLCDLNLKYWPFDTQQCKLILGSWTYNGEQIDLTATNDTATLELLVTSSEWTITNSSVVRHSKYYPCCAEAYTDITIEITVVRFSPVYKAIIIAPLFVIIVLVLLSFWLPPQAGEKILLNACTAVIICIFMLYFTQKIPAMGTHTPLIILFYSHCLYIVTFSMVTSVVVIWMSRTHHSHSLPRVIKKPLRGFFGKLLGLNVQQENLETSEEMVHPDSHFQERNGKSSLQQEWILLAVAIDRIAFCFFIILFGILAIC